MILSLSKRSLCGIRVKRTFQDFIRHNTRRKQELPGIEFDRPSLFSIRLRVSSLCRRTDHYHFTFSRNRRYAMKQRWSNFASLLPVPADRITLMTPLWTSSSTFDQKTISTVNDRLTVWMKSRKRCKIKGDFKTIMTELWVKTINGLNILATCFPIIKRSENIPTNNSAKLIYLTQELIEV